MNDVDFLQMLVNYGCVTTPVDLVERKGYAVQVPSLVYHFKVLSSFISQLVKFCGESSEGFLRSGIIQVKLPVPQFNTLTKLIKFCNNFHFYVCSNQLNKVFRIINLNECGKITLTPNSVHFYEVSDQLLDFVLDDSYVLSDYQKLVTFLPNQTRTAQFTLYLQSDRKMEQFEETNISSFFFQRSYQFEPRPNLQFFTTKLHFDEYCCRQSCQKLTISYYPSQLLSGKNCYYCLHCFEEKLIQLFEEQNSLSSQVLADFFSFLDIQNHNFDNFLCSLFRNRNGSCSNLQYWLQQMLVECYMKIKICKMASFTVQPQLSTQWQNLVFVEAIEKLTLFSRYSTEKDISLEEQQYKQYQFLATQYQKGPTMLITHSPICPDYIIEMYSSPWKSCSTNFYEVKQFEKNNLCCPLTVDNVLQCIKYFEKFQICLFVEIGFNLQYAKVQYFNKPCQYGLIIRKPINEKLVKGLLALNQCKQPNEYMREKDIQTYMNELEIRESQFQNSVKTQENDKQVICLKCCDEQIIAKTKISAGMYFNQSFYSICLPCVDYYLQTACQRSMKNNMEGISLQLHEEQNLASIIDALLSSNICATTINNFLTQIIANNGFQIDMKYCPDHPYFPAISTGGVLNCPFCNKFFCFECHNWHSTESLCFTIKVCSACQLTVPVPSGKSRYNCIACGFEQSILKMQEPKRCPKCGVISIKYEGCNHMTCPRCQCHWCYLCVKSFSYQDIYRHLSIAHGGFF